MVAWAKAAAKQMKSCGVLAQGCKSSRQDFLAFGGGWESVQSRMAPRSWAGAAGRMERWVELVQGGTRSVLFCLRKTPVPCAGGRPPTLAVQGCGSTWKGMDHGAPDIDGAGSRGEPWNRRVGRQLWSVRRPGFFLQVLCLGLPLEPCDLGDFLDLPFPGTPAMVWLSPCLVPGGSGAVTRKPWSHCVPFKWKEWGAGIV